jgi:putative exosortase-associated protein (TIGR04073 family)
VLGASGTCAAAGTQDAYHGSLRKLGRGIANVFTCPLELLERPQQVARRDGWLAASTVGVLQGAWRTVQRAGTGLFEVGTFYAEIPEGYAPLMEPEFAFGHDTWESIDE